MAKKVVRVSYTGRVHGVGFRFTAERLAQTRGINGYVKNLFDGSVELVGEGEESILRSWLAEIKSAMEPYIDNENIEWRPASEDYSEFTIRF